MKDGCPVNCCFFLPQLVSKVLKLRHSVVFAVKDNSKEESQKSLAKKMMMGHLLMMTTTPMIPQEPAHSFCVDYEIVFFVCFHFGVLNLPHGELDLLLINNPVASRVLLSAARSRLNNSALSLSPSGPIVSGSAEPGSDRSCCGR